MYLIHDEYQVYQGDSSVHREPPRNGLAAFVFTVGCDENEAGEGDYRIEKDLALHPLRFFLEVHLLLNQLIIRVHRYNGVRLKPKVLHLVLLLLAVSIVASAIETLILLLVLKLIPIVVVHY